MRFLLTLLVILLPLHSMALPNPQTLRIPLLPPQQHPHIPGHPLIPDPTKKSKYTTSTDTERLESLSAKRLYEVIETVATLQSTLRESISAREDRLRELEWVRDYYLARQNSVIVNPGPEIEENDWDGNFTMPAGPRPPPKSAPF